MFEIDYFLNNRKIAHISYQNILRPEYIRHNMNITRFFSCTHDECFLPKSYPCYKVYTTGVCV